MRISDWSSDVCSSDLFQGARLTELGQLHRTDVRYELGIHYLAITTLSNEDEAEVVNIGGKKSLKTRNAVRMVPLHPVVLELGFLDYVRGLKSRHLFPRSEEHTSELQSLMRISNAV